MQASWYRREDCSPEPCSLRARVIRCTVLPAASMSCPCHDVNMCRSLAASEQLSRSGYQNLAWINGGFETARQGDLPITGAVDVRMAGIGGLSKLLGWTEVQQHNGKGFLGGSNTLLRIVRPPLSPASILPALPAPCLQPALSSSR